MAARMRIIWHIFVPRKLNEPAATSRKPIAEDGMNAWHLLTTPPPQQQGTAEGGRPKDGQTGASPRAKV